MYGRQRVSVKLTHPPRNWLDVHSPVIGITEHSTHWFGVVSRPVHSFETYLPGPQSWGVRQGLHAASTASNVVPPEHVALSGRNWPLGQKELQGEHTRFAVVMQGLDWKLPAGHAVLHGVHCRFCVGVHTLLSKSVPFLHCKHAAHVLASPSFCTFMLAILYDTPASHRIHWVPAPFLMYPALHSLPETHPTRQCRPYRSSTSP